MAVIIMRRRFFGIVRENIDNKRHISFFALWLPVLRKEILPWGVRRYVLGMRIDDAQAEKEAADQYYLRQQIELENIEKQRREEERQKAEEEKRKAEEEKQKLAERIKNEQRILAEEREHKEREELVKKENERIENAKRLIEKVRTREIYEYSPEAKPETNINISLTEDTKVKSVLIVSTFGIGDYVFLRNFFKIMKNYERFKDAKITAILSETVRDLSDYLDKDVVDTFFYVPHPFWKLPINEQFGEADKLFKNGLKRYYDIVVYPSYNRFVSDDFNLYLQYNIFSHESYITSGDIPIESTTQIQNNRFFTHIVNNLDGLNQFEFENNKKVFEAVVGQKLDVKMHFIEKDKLTASEYKGEKYAVINPAAQDGFRVWHPLNFVKIIKWLNEHKQMKTIIVCSASEKPIADFIHTLTGEISMVKCGAKLDEVLRTINDASLYIGNDSGCFHLAVSLKIKAICISGGNSFGRFMNYPFSDDYKILIDKSARELLLHKQTKYVIWNYSGAVNAVSVEEVKKAVEELNISEGCKLS